ncbi:MAG: molybdopterin cofactor-binding domain-containing protein, partial [Rickettsiales bacterium]
MDGIDPGKTIQAGDQSLVEPQPAMARTRVRYVGEIVAMVVAETAHAARDGAERVAVSFDTLPAVIDVRDAVEPGAPIIDPRFPDNICFRVVFGDREKTDRVFAGAAHVTSIEHVQNRGIGAPIETRGYIGAWDADAERFTLHATAGKPHPVRNTL